MHSAILALLATFALVPGLAFGQSRPDVFVPGIPKMMGTVVDLSGGVIVNAKVTLYRKTEATIVNPNATVTLYRNTEKEPVAITQTDAKGKFQFLIGKDRLFKVLVEAECFKPTIIEEIRRKWDGSMKLPPITLQVQSEPSCRR